MTDHEAPTLAPDESDAAPEDSWELLPGAKRAIANQIAQIVLTRDQDRRNPQYEPRVRIAATTAAVAIQRQHLAEQKAARNDDRTQTIIHQHQARLAGLAQHIRDIQFAHVAVADGAARGVRRPADVPGGFRRTEEPRRPGPDGVGE